MRCAATHTEDTRGVARAEVEREPVVRQLGLRLRRLVASSPSPPIVVLEAGHFDPRRGADEFCLASMSLALEICAHFISEYQRRIRVVLSVLVDDLALGCGATKCRVSPSPAGNASTALPKELEDLIATSRFAKRDRLLVMSERNAKNRGIEWLRDASSRSRLPESIRTYEELDSTRFELATEGAGGVTLATARGSRWSGRCPLVMGQHYADLAMKVERRFTPAHPQMIVDFSLACERGKVLSGAELAVRALFPRGDAFGQRQIVTVFSDPRCKSHVVEDVCDDDFVLITQS